MKIMMLNDNLVKGGRERRLLELLKGLAQYPEVTCELVIFSDKIAYQEVYDLGIPLHILERKPAKDPRVFFRLYQLCRKFQPDIIHSWGSMTSVYAIPAAKMLGIKLLNAMVADAPQNQGWRDTHWLRGRLTFPFSDAVLGNSRAGLQAYGAPRFKSHCFHNGFDFKRIARLKPATEVRTQFGIETPLVVGMVGAVEDRKDYTLFVEVAKAVLQVRDDVSFVAVGDGKNLAACRARIPAAYQNRIIFTGNQNEVESIINTFDIGVLMTNQSAHGEGISNAIMEYMALGKPVVATWGGGTPEIVTEGETGYLIREATTTAWADKLIYLFDHPALAARMGAAGRLRIQHFFNLEQMTSSYFQLYQRLLGITPKHPQIS
ncbi:MAG: hypothetical protein DA408_00230 [Bacteroidetes bacterium]|nr:MAG: hypothetical protein DA408_00230 [Bacteroidota bacterium]